MLFDGLCAFPITPASADGIVDTAALDSLIRRLTDAGVDSIGLLGSTGTAPYFARAERSRAVSAAAEAAGDTPIMVGIGALRTDQAVSLARDAAAAGAHGLLLPPIAYIPLTEEEVYRHCSTVAAATDLPLCLYNNPAATHFTFTPALTARLSRVARIAAVKNPAPSGNVAAELAALRQEASPGFSIGVSVDWRAADAMLAGADAWYSVLAGILPGPCVAIARAIRQGDAVHAQALNAAARWRIAAVLDAIRKEGSASF
jgi:4-hydroxy-tetrahydrodipicolinate synthase